MHKILACMAGVGHSKFSRIGAARADDGTGHRRTIDRSITICSLDPGGMSLQLAVWHTTPSGPLSRPGAPTQTINQAGIGTATDEHSTVFPPGYLGDNRDYLFFVASGSKGVNPDIGMMVLSSPGPDKHGQWSAQPATANRYGNYTQSSR